jgi:hypothetical protein
MNQDINWNYRKLDKRLVITKTKNEKVRKIAVIDVLTNVPFAMEIPQDVSMDSLESEKEYLANVKVYTAKNLEGIDKEFTEFFEELDIDQPTEDFIKAYWIYPSKIKFELTEAEEP